MTIKLLNSILFWLKLTFGLLCSLLVVGTVAAYISLNARLERLESPPTIELSDDLIWSIIEDTANNKTSDLGGFSQNLSAVLVLFNKKAVVPEMGEIEVTNYKRAIDILNPQNINFKVKLAEFPESTVDIGNLMTIFGNDPLNFDLVFTLSPRYGPAEEPLFLINALDLQDKVSLLEEVPRNLPTDHILTREELDSLWNVKKLSQSIGGFSLKM